MGEIRKDYNQFSMSYLYWDQFVSAWSCGAKFFCGWTDPDSIPLYNNSDNKDLSSLYVPEPWWGNDGTQVLQSVVINYNPGEGQCYQKTGCVGNISLYGEDIVRSSNFGKTQKWHRKKRALPILESLNRCYYIHSPFGLENHLCIELIPWHTKKTDSGYWDYVKANPTAICNNVIAFAANEAARIQNDKLRNTVLLRMSGTNTRKLLSILGQNTQYSIGRSDKTASSETNFLEFELSQFAGTRFISFWGRKIRNGMPSPLEMDELLESGFSPESGPM